MKRRNADLHGSVVDHSNVVLLLVDVINAMDFPEGEQLARHARPVAHVIHRLRDRARAANVPVVYANDNFGQWRSDFRATLANAKQADKPGREIATLLEPDETDYFVLKPKHSAFFGTSLELLLSYFGAHTLVIAGFAGDICIRFTAQDAFLHDFGIVVPRDAIASERPASNRAALAFMRDQLGARTPLARSVDFAALRK